VIVVVASWGADRAMVLTPRDLSVSGWRQYTPAERPSVAVIAGRKIPIREILGVITCLPRVTELELLHIAADDRGYVAAEMTAFLLAWLTALPCPVMNRPSPMSLVGPFWRREQWAAFAARAGLPVSPISRQVSLEHVGGSGIPSTVPVTVVGSRVAGNAHRRVLDGVRRLAGAAGVEILTVEVSEAGQAGAFVSAEPAPDLSRNQTADQILEHLTGGVN
jgi:hypothetical protein